MAHKHPDTQTLDRFAAGALTRRVGLRIGWHVFNCSECRQSVECTADGRGAKRLAGSLETQSEQGRQVYDAVLSRTFDTLVSRQADLELDRQRAPQLFAELVRHPTNRQRVLITNTRRFDSWGLVEHILEHSAKAWFENPAMAEPYAALALAIAEKFTEPQFQTPIVNDLKGRCWVYLANSKRVTGDFVAAEHAFEQAENLLKLGTGDPIEKAFLLRRKATLRLQQRHFDEAELLLQRAISTFKRIGEPHSAGLTMVTLAVMHRERGEIEDAIALLRRASKLIEPHRDPAASLGVQHNLISYLTEVGRFMEARALLVKSRELYERQAGPVLQQKLLWTQGKIAYGLGQAHQAESCYLRARQALSDLGYPIGAALVCFDLAELYAREGRIADLKQLAEEMMLTFQGFQIERETLASFILFQEAIKAGEVTVAMIREMAESAREQESRYGRNPLPRV